MKKILSLFFTWVVFLSYGQMRVIDKLNIKEAEKIKQAHANKTWHGFKEIPLTVLFLTDTAEYLINHPKPGTSFNLLTFDSILQTNVYYRRPKLNKRFLATFSVDGYNTIVIGTPENTGKTKAEWIVTLLHESFHLYQYASKKYEEAVKNLNLSGGDKTGMWMLNYPFPYDSIPVQNRYMQYTSALKKLNDSINSRSFRKLLRNYKSMRKNFRESISASDYKYFSFQLWQEGIARYTEYKFLESIVSVNDNTMGDLSAYKALHKKLFNNEMNNLLTLPLQAGKRICFYSVGLAEAVLKDRLSRGWRNQYFSRRFFIEKM